MLNLIDLSDFYSIQMERHGVASENMRLTLSVFVRNRAIIDEFLKLNPASLDPCSGE
jgi:hypothetical protein